MQALIWSVLSWVLREVVIKFIIVASFLAVFAIFVPWAVEYLLPFIGVASLDAAFAFITPGVWYFLDFFDFGFGLPVLISAYVARFLIRRIPVIG